MRTTEQLRRRDGTIVVVEIDVVSVGRRGRSGDPDEYPEWVVCSATDDDGPVVLTSAEIEWIDRSVCRPPNVEPDEYRRRA
jgi:hypothetical protein